MSARRIVMVLMSTVTVVVLLFGYRTSTVGRPGERTVTAAGPASGSRASRASTTGTVTGPTVQTQWGPVQVRLTVTAGKITTVDVVQYPNGNPRDAEINGQALPTLRTETVDAQSADIDMVSGATVTSDGYLQSLQGAIDKAGL
jgi:uncharacterized protein with FMN-binding domain